MTAHPNRHGTARPAGPATLFARSVTIWASIAVLMAALALPQAAAAADRSGETVQPAAPQAERALARLNARLVEILNDGTKDTADRERALARTLRAHLDFDTLSRFVLGRYAATLSDAQTDTFQQAFSDYVVGTYARVLARNAIAGMTVLQSRKVTDETAAVATRVERTGRPDARWLWRLHRGDSGRWGVVDLQTPTASLAVNYRSEFGHLLESRGFDALIQLIRTHTQNGAVLAEENRAILMLIRGLQADRLALTAQ